MDKYEYRLKTDHIKQVAARKDYVAAARLCDSIDWNKVRDVKMLGIVAEIYTAVDRYQDAIDALIQAYDYAPIGRRIVYRLTELALEADNYEDANEYFEEFCRIAPHDQGRYILLYKMACSQHATVAEKIKILESYKREDFDEKWAYELATLYARSRQIDKCVQLCDDIILWFGLGKFVEKALALKARYAPLTEDQKEKAKALQAQKDARDYEERKEDIKEIQGVPDSVRELQVDSELDAVGKVTAEAVRSIEKETAKQEPVPVPAPQFKKAPEVKVLHLDETSADARKEKRQAVVSENADKFSKLVADNHQKAKSGIITGYEEQMAEQFKAAKVEFDASQAHVPEGPVASESIEMFMMESERAAKRGKSNTKTALPRVELAQTRTDIWPSGVATPETRDAVEYAEELAVEEIELVIEGVPEQQEKIVYEEPIKREELVREIAGSKLERKQSAADEIVEEPIDGDAESSSVQDEYNKSEYETEEDEYEEEEYEEDEYDESEYETEEDEYKEEEYGEVEYEEDEYDESEYETEEDEYEEEEYDESEYETEEDEYGEEEYEEVEYEEDEYDESEYETEEDEYEEEEYGEDEYDESEYETGEDEYGEEEYEEVEYEEDEYEESKYEAEEESPEVEYDEVAFAPEDAQYVVEAVQEAVDMTEIALEEDAVADEDTEITESEENSAMETAKSKEQAVSDNVEAAEDVSEESAAEETQGAPGTGEAEGAEVETEEEKTSASQVEIEDIVDAFFVAETAQVPVMNPEDLTKVWHFAVNVPEGESPMDCVMEYIRTVGEHTERPFPTQAARVTGAQLNNKDLLQSFDKLLGKIIIVINAGEMESRIVDEFCQVLEPNDRSILVILADSPTRLSRLFSDYPKLAGVFTVQFMESHYTAAELLDYAKEYADRQDSVLDKTAELYLMEQIEEIVNSTERDKKQAVELMINRAIEFAEQRTFGLRSLFTVRYDKEGRLRLTEKHFK